MAYKPNTSEQRSLSIGLQSATIESKGKANFVTNGKYAVDKSLAFVGANAKSAKPVELKRGSPKLITMHHMEIAEALFAANETISVVDMFQSEEAYMLKSDGMGGKNIFYPILDTLQDQLRKTPDVVQNPPPRLREFSQRLFVKYPELLNPSSTEDHNQGLLEKLLKKCKPLAFDLIGLVISEEDIQAFESPCPYEETTTESCPLSQFYLSKALQDEFGTQQKGWQCLHQQVDPERFGAWIQTFRDAMAAAVEPSNESTKQYDSWLHLMLDDELAFSDKRSKTEMQHFHKSFLSLIRLCSSTNPQKNVFRIYGVDGNTPLHKAINIFNCNDTDYDLVANTIEVLIHQCPDSIYLAVQGKGSNKVPITPYRLLKALSANVDKKQQTSIKEVETLMRHVCIRSDKSKTDKQKYLNESLAEAPEIHLDLATVKGPGSIYMDARAEKVKSLLDSTLEYVSLPQWQPEESMNFDKSSPVTSAALSSEQGKAEGKIFDSHVSIFNWLKTKEVNKIFRVSVEDRKPGITSHTDTAIQNCLVAFDVEIWDWRKYDISSQTILNGAKNTRELRLYWSGNLAVMQGWACKRGLVQLKKAGAVVCPIHLPTVQSITISLSEMVMEPDEVYKTAFNDFKEKFCKRRKDISENNIRLRILKTSNDASNKPGERSSPEGQLESEPAWIKNMQPIIDMLNNQTKRETAVKIALIDKGVDREHPEVLHIEKGQSFYHSGRDLAEYELWDSKFLEWDANPPVHGTRMAICIQKVCPMARLYVARMDDSNPDSQEFTLSSAIKAVEWAQEMGVDVISMSWSFKSKGGHYNAEEVETFTKAVAEAKSKGILLFASLNDAEAATTLEYYPCGLMDVFKIGSATKWGERAPYSRSGADFILPGQDIQLSNIDSQTTAVSGSSIATAFAAGLAGLVLQALITHNSIDDDVDETQKAERLKQAKSKEGMNIIFNILSGFPQGDKKDTWVSLAGKFPEKVDISNWQVELKDFVQGICPR